MKQLEKLKKQRERLAAQRERQRKLEIKLLSHLIKDETPVAPTPKVKSVHVVIWSANTLSKRLTRLKYDSYSVTG